MPAFVAVCDLLHRRGVAGATALLGVDGTARGRRERARFFSRNAEVPMMVVAVGSGDRIGQVLPELGALLRRPLVTLERVQVCKRDGRLLAPPAPLPAADEHGMALWHKLMIFSSEAAQHGGQPVHRAMVRRLRSAGISGATTLRGIWGFHGDHPPHGDRVLQLGRHVPVVTIVIDTPERIATAFPIIDELTSEHGLVTSETIPALRAAAGDRRRGGPRLATHRRASPGIGLARPDSRAIVAIAACVKYVADARSRRRSRPGWSPADRRTQTSTVKLLVANRAEIAVRIMATAAVLGIDTVAVYPDDDAACAARGPGRRRGAPARERAPPPYLDVGAIVGAATGSGCDTLHPGYGFLAENGALRAGLRRGGPPLRRARAGGARRCSATRAAARARAAELGIPAGPGHRWPGRARAGARVPGQPRPRRPR